MEHDMNDSSVWHLHLGISNDPSSMNDDVLPDCPPSKISNADFSRAIGHSSEEMDAMGIVRLYTSQLIDLAPTAEPPYALLQKNWTDILGSKEQDVLQDFCVKLLQLMDGNDECDRVGEKYIGRLLGVLCPGSTNFDELSQQSKELVLDLLSYPASENVVIKNAIRWSGCSYKNEEHQS